MFSTSNHWGFKASKKQDQTFIPGTSKWVSNEMNEANKLILQDSKYFSRLVQTELALLNEIMLQVLNSEEDVHGDALLLLRSPVKLTSKDSPVKKIRQDALLEIQSKVVLSPPLERPQQPVFELVKEKKEIMNDNKSLEKEKIIEQVQLIIPNNRRLHEQKIPKLVSLKEEFSKFQQNVNPIPHLAQQQHHQQNHPLQLTSEDSLTLTTAEKLSPIELSQNKDKLEDFDSSFQAITRTIKLTKELTIESHSKHHSSTVLKTVLSKGELPTESGIFDTKLPLTTPNADKFSLTSFASLPSREPLTVKSTKKDRLSTKISSTSPNQVTQDKNSQLTSIYPSLSRLEPLPKHLFQDDKNDNSPFQASRESSSNDWVPPSPKKENIKSRLSKQGKSELPKDSPLNTIFAKAIRRARNLISPSKENEKPEKPEADKPTKDIKSVKRVVSSKGSRGNLMDRLTADTESSALRNMRKLDLRPVSKVYPEMEITSIKRYSESPLAKKYNGEHKTATTLLDSMNSLHSSIPKLPVFKATLAPMVKQKSPIRSKRPATNLSPEKPINNQELSKVNGSKIASTATEIRKKRLKTQESLTNLSLNKNLAPKRLSTISQQRINKRMADERLRIEGLRKQRLSSSLKAISIDEQLKKPLHKMREKSLKTVEPLVTTQDEAKEKDSRLPKRKVEVESKIESHHALLPLSDELLNRKRKTDERGLEQKPSRVVKGKLVTKSIPTSSTSTSARTQTLMRTAMIQHARLTKPGGRNPTEAPKSIHSTPDGKLPISMTPNSKSPALLPEIFSEPEDDDEGHILKEWAESPELKRQLVKQQNINPDTIFGAIAPLNMDEIFKVSRVARFRARSSSAHWGVQDMLSHKEADDYRRKMGWKN